MTCSRETCVEPRVTPPVKIGDHIHCLCGETHVVALLMRGAPVLSCPSALRDPMYVNRFPAAFHDGQIVEITRVPD